MKYILFIAFALLPSAAYPVMQYGDIVIHKVASVYDGDTFRAIIPGWPKIVGESVPVRVAGIDTPEIRTKCAHEKELGYQAKQLSMELLTHGQTIELKNIKRGKYFRLVADVYIDGESLGQQLIEAGLAVPYDGGTKVDWCVKIGNKKEL